MSEELKTGTKRNICSNSAIGLIAIVAIVNFSVLGFWNQENRVIAWDVISYYAYLPASFIQNDIYLEFLDDPNRDYSSQFWPQTTETGQRVIKTTMGVAYFYLPGFITGQIAASLSGYEANGFSIPYRFSLQLNGIMFLILGMVTMRRVLQTWFSDVVIAITLVAVTAGTNLYHYGVVESTYSHVYSFFLFALFLLITINYYKNFNGEARTTRGGGTLRPAAKMGAGEVKKIGGVTGIWGTTSTGEVIIARNKTGTGEETGIREEMGTGKVSGAGIESGGTEARQVTETVETGGAVNIGAEAVRESSGAEAENGTSGTEADRKRANRLLAAAGFTAGLITLIRPVNILVVIIFIFWKTDNLQGIKKRFFWFISSPSQVAIMILFFLLPWIPQLLYWKEVTGEWLYYSYQDEGFFFLKPHILEGLFSFRKGLFIYTPLTLLMLSGMLLLRRRLSDPAIALWIFTPLFVYTVFSWWCWWYGGSFGQRPFVESYAIYAIPLATLIEWALKQKRRVKTILLSLLLILSLHGVFQTFQYYYGAIHWDSMTREAWTDSFGRINPSEEFWQLISEPDYEGARLTGSEK